VGLGKLAAQIGRSKGHLSKVERNVDNRAVSPALIRDYQLALGVKVSATASDEVSATRNPGLPDEVSAARVAMHRGSVNTDAVLDLGGAWPITKGTTRQPLAAEPVCRVSAEVSIPEAEGAPFDNRLPWRPPPVLDIAALTSGADFSPVQTSSTETFLSQLFGHIGGMTAAADMGQSLSARQRDAALKDMINFFMNWATNMDRRALLRLLGWAAVAAGTNPYFGEQEEDQQERFVAAVHDPGRVDSTTIGWLEQVLTNCMQQDDSLGPYAVLDTVLVQRSLADVMLRECEDHLRSRLLSVFANFSRYAGWLSFDLRDFDGANYYYEQARSAAHDAQNAELGALVLCNLSHLATWRGRPRTGIDHAVAAQAWAGQTDDLLLRAYAADVAARAYAMDRQEKPCLKQIEVAQEYVTKPQTVPTLVPFYNPGLLDSIHGLCLLSLDQPALAVEHHEKSLEGIDPAYVRNFAFNKAYLSMAQARSEDIDAAANTLGDAAELSTYNRSPRLVQQVHTVRDELTPWEDALAVRQLDERLQAYGFARERSNT
jgi:tetratricopeptide (TPR) repeat protein